MPSVQIDVPDGVNVDAIIQGANYLIADEQRRQQNTIDYKLVLESDDHLRAWAKNIKHQMIVRADRYSVVWHEQELWPSLTGAPVLPDKEDSRRPVLMKGAIDVLIAKYSHSSAHIANGYAERVISRYLRLNKYTCLDRKEHEENMRPIHKWARRNFHLSHKFSLTDDYDFAVHKPSELSGQAWIAGQHVKLTDHQFKYITNLQAIAFRARRLEAA